MTISDHAPSENRFQSLVEASSMIDHKFDTFRSRDPDARQERGQAARRGTGDSLAELARLIGRDANGGRHNTHSPARSADGGFSGLNWAAEKAYPEQRQQGEVAPRAPTNLNPMSLCRKSVATRRSRRPADIFPDPPTNLMASMKTASIRQRLTMFNTATTGSRFRSAEIVGRRFSRATEYRRSCSRRRWPT
jgi:hypothetical protein